MQEKELYSKACVARSIKFVIDKAKDESVHLKDYENFSCNVATILARDKEVVAVRLIPYSNKCEVYIAKNSPWLKEDIAYIDKIKKYVKNLSKDAPIKLDKALEREDVRSLFEDVLNYCSDKLFTRFEKLINDIKKDIINNQQNYHIKSFMDFASINAENIDEVNGYVLSNICSIYYDKFKNSSAPKKFLRHIKKLGSYYAALIDITACACKDKYKLLFSNMNMHKLEPIVISQPIFSWENIVQKYIPDHTKYKEFKRRCLDDDFISKRLTEIYGNVNKLDNESIEQHIYLHAEMNLLTNIIDQKYKGRAFIAVSTRSCYLCELYIRFVNKKGYNIYISGAHKKLYSKWVLPKIKNTDLRNESLKDMIKQLDEVINEELVNHISIVMRSDSDGESVKSSTNPNIHKKGGNLIRARLAKLIPQTY
ncbi:hypothetical protein C1645_838242 [Glomus cerebriforme]|uniref:Uncharacterized protein n=1 Tax=Glomus cerebriforme TaxID=658196 RepID=A0A397S7F6_9GLOM|nr:hypothetical protein C1645_838242 [Glomus cerebriforme]